MTNKKKIKDELDLIDLFIQIWNGKWKIFSITIVITIFAYFYNSLRQTHVSEFLLEIKPINQNEMLMYDKFNSLELLIITPEKLLKEYLDELENFSTLLKNSNHENKSIANELSSNENYNTIINSLVSLIKINPSINNFAFNRKDLKNVSTISFKHEDTNKAKDVIYSLHSLINQNVIKKIEKKFKKSLETRSMNNDMYVKMLDLRILTIQEKYTQILSNRLAFLQEQANIARSLGWSEPVPESLILEEKKLPQIYSRGYKILEKEIAALKSRNNKNLMLMDELIEEEANKKYHVLKNNFVNLKAEKEFELAFKNNFSFSAASVNSKINEPKKLNNKFNLIVIVVCGITIGLMYVLFFYNFLKFIKTRLIKKTK